MRRFSKIAIALESIMRRHPQLATESSCERGDARWMGVDVHTDSLAPVSSRLVGMQVCACEQRPSLDRKHIPVRMEVMNMCSVEFSE